MRDYRNVFAVVLAVCFMQAAAGLLGVIVPLDLRALGAGNSGVGLVAAAYAAGFMAGAALSPRFVARVGHIRCFSGFAALGAAASLFHYLIQDPAVWALLRAVVGFTLAAMFTAAESWITQSAPHSRRGAVLGFYQVAIKVAVSFGPVVALGRAPLAAEPFLWIAIGFCLAVLPIAATKMAQPTPPSTEPLPILDLIRLAPAAAAGVIIAGVFNTGLLTFLPVFGASVRPGDPVTGAALIMAAAFIGGTVTQWPAGKLSDRIDRRWAVAGLAAIAAVAAAVLWLRGGAVGFTGALALAALWGAGALSFYSICVAHAADRASPDQIARVIAGLLFLWAGGSVFGPILAGLIAESALGLGGVFAFSLVGMVLLIAAMTWRTQARPRPETPAPFENAPATSVAAAEIDPRGETA